MFEPCSAGNQDRTDIPGETAGGGDGWSVEISVVGVVEGGFCGTVLGSGWDRATASTFSGPGR